jgi:hypothetical protein
MVTRVVVQRNQNKHQRLFKPGPGSLKVGGLE